MATTFFVVFLILHVLTVNAIQDECHNYKTLPDDRDRSRDNVLVPDPSNIPCDDAFTGWYRLSAGVMATSCVPKDHCGTSSPIWMKDSVPNVGQTRENKFCVNHKSSQGEPCCLFSFNINVTNCGGYLVYDLKGDELLCPSGYCIENVTACPEGTSSTNGFEPCTDIFPVMNDSPSLSAPVIVSDYQDFTQTCTVDYTGSGGEFHLKWFFDGVLYREVVLKNGTLDDTLHSSDWTGHVGKSLECEVTGYLHYAENATHSKPLRSQSYFGGITVTPHDVYIHEPYEKDVTLVSTLPVVCPNVAKENCSLQLDADLQGALKYDLFMRNGCGVTLRPDMWDSKHHSTTTKVTLATALDTVTKYPYEYFVDFVPRTSNGHDMWRNYDINKAMVHISDTTTYFWSIYGSTHNNDLRHQMGDIRFPGDYLVYTGGSGDHHLKIHARLWTPHLHAPSICAVAVQYDDALILVDMCTNNVDMTAPVVTQGDSNPDNLRVYLCGAAYRIVTGDGNTVTININEFSLDIKIQTNRAYQQNKDTGLVKNEGEQTLHDVSKFLLDKNTSFFEEAGKPFFEVKSQTPKYSPTYCTCRNGVSECDPILRLQDPLCTVLHNKQMSCVSSCKLIVPESINPEAGGFQVQRPQDYAGLKTSWPHMLSDAQIEHTCRERMHSAINSHKYCHYVDLQVKDIVKACIKDYQTSGGLYYIESAVLGVRNSCIRETSVNRNMYTMMPSGKLTFVDDLWSQICPDHCNGHGNCQHGKCVCNSGYTGDDCSLEVGKPPRILGIKGGGVCGMSSPRCLHPIFVTRNVEDSQTITAKVTPVEILSGINPVTQNTSLYIEPIYENKYSVSLRINSLFALYREQSSFGIMVELSNDGITFSNSYSYYIYDDRCLFCDTSISSCVQQPWTCHIAGKCYMDGDVNPLNPSQVCNSQNALIVWSDKNCKFCSTVDSSNI